MEQIMIESELPKKLKIHYSPWTNKSKKLVMLRTRLKRKKVEIFYSLRS